MKDGPGQTVPVAPKEGKFVINLIKKLAKIQFSYVACIFCKYVSKYDKNTINSHTLNKKLSVFQECVTLACIHSKYYRLIIYIHNMLNKKSFFLLEVDILADSETEDMEPETPHAASAADQGGPTAVENLTVAAPVLVPAPVPAPPGFERTRRLLNVSPSVSSY